MRYLRNRVISLRHGCLCNDHRVYWSLSRIAEALGLHVNDVRNILLRLRAQNFGFPERRRQQNWSPKKLTQAQIEQITTTAEL